MYRKNKQSKRTRWPWPLNSFIGKYGISALVIKVVHLSQRPWLRITKQHLVALHTKRTPVSVYSPTFQWYAQNTLLCHMTCLVHFFLKANRVLCTRCLHVTRAFNVTPPYQTPSTEQYELFSDLTKNLSIYCSSLLVISGEYPPILSHQFLLCQ